MVFSSGRNKHPTESFCKSRAGKSTSTKHRSFREHSSFRRPEKLDLSFSKHQPPKHIPDARQLNSPVITLSVGSSPPRLFAAHTDVLTTSPYFTSLLHSQYYNSSSHQLQLEEETPEVFSSVLEYLYKGDYFPALAFDARRNIWSLENATVSPGNVESTVWMPSSSSTLASGAQSPTLMQPHPTNPAAGHGVYVLKDTAVYCAAERYQLPQLKRVALRKQGLQSGIPVATILASARFAYAHTPENDRHLRAHYLALIIRSRNTFKRSGTMQVEMGAVNPGAAGKSMPVRARTGEGGTGLWFDLFVAMCNHLDDMEEIVKSPRAR